MAVGFVKRNSNNELVPETLAGPVGGSVNKLEYGCNKNYALTLTENTSGDGFVGVSCCKPIYYNPNTGTLTVECINSVSSKATCAECVGVCNTLHNNIWYDVPFLCDCKFYRGDLNNIRFNPVRGSVWSCWSETLQTWSYDKFVVGDYDGYHLDFNEEGLCCVKCDEAYQGHIVSCTRLNTFCCADNSITWHTSNVFDCSVTAPHFIGHLCGNADTATGTSTHNHYCLGSFTGDGDCPLAISANGTDLGYSATCPLTYNPATGVMKRYDSEMSGYDLMLPSAYGGTRYALVDVGSSDEALVIGKQYSNSFSLVKTCGGDYIFRHGVDNYGNIAAGHINDTTSCVWLRYESWIPPVFLSRLPIKLVCTQTTAPDGITFNASISCVCQADTARQVRNDPAAGSTAELVYSQMADNDFFRISTGGDSNAGWAEIATADDGNEPIYVRQYTGVFSNVTRTATLLDANGNTCFPGDVYATGYSVSLGACPAGTNTPALRMWNSTDGQGYNGGAYIGHCNANYDGYWGYATFGFYNAENGSLCQGLCVSRTGKVYAPDIWGETLCAGGGGIRTEYDVNGYCDDNEHTHTWYIYCDGSACFSGDVHICGELHAASLPKISRNGTSLIVCI